MFENPEVIPDQLSEVILNLDVIITHIMHTIGTENEYVPEPTNASEEHEFVQNVVTPIVI